MLYFKKILNYKGFSFIELIISITIVIILSSLGFISYSEHLENTRDTQRKSDLFSISSALNLNKTKRGNLPYPSSAFNITYNGVVVANQGKFDESIIISGIDKLPKDPFIEIPYVYSIGANRQEFQLVTTLENNGENIAYINGNYKSVSKNILPNIVLAINSTTDVEIKDGVGNGTINRTKFIFDNLSHNLPYSFNTPYYPYSDKTNFSGLLSDPNIKFNTKNDYKDCNQIIDAGKNFGTGEYQVNKYGSITNVTCNSSKILTSCKEIKLNFPSSTDGIYTIIPNGSSKSFSVYCNMTIEGGGWTLMAKDGTTYDYKIGNCNFSDPTNNITKESTYNYWSCNLGQSEILLWTPSGWITGGSSKGNSCALNTTKTNNNTCLWSSPYKTFEIKAKGGCMTSINPTKLGIWWFGYNRESTVSKDLSFISSPVTGTCNSSPQANNSYCTLFDVQDSTGNGIGQWENYRAAACGTQSSGISAEVHLIYVR